MIGVLPIRAYSNSKAFGDKIPNFQLLEQFLRQSHKFFMNSGYLSDNGLIEFDHVKDLERFMSDKKFIYDSDPAYQQVIDGLSTINIDYAKLESTPWDKAVESGKGYKHIPNRNPLLVNRVLDIVKEIQISKSLGKRSKKTETYNDFKIQNQKKIFGKLTLLVNLAVTALDNSDVTVDLVQKSIEALDSGNIDDNITLISIAIDDLEDRGADVSDLLETLEKIHDNEKNISLMIDQLRDKNVEPLLIALDKAEIVDRKLSSKLRESIDRLRTDSNDTDLLDEIIGSLEKSDIRYDIMKTAVNQYKNRYNNIKNAKLRRMWIDMLTKAIDPDVNQTRLTKIHRDYLSRLNNRELRRQWMGSFREAIFLFKEIFDLVNSRQTSVPKPLKIYLSEDVIGKMGVIGKILKLYRLYVLNTNFNQVFTKCDRGCIIRKTYEQILSKQIIKTMGNRNIDQIYESIVRMGQILYDGLKPGYKWDMHDQKDLDKMQNMIQVLNIPRLKYLYELAGEAIGHHQYIIRLNESSFTVGLPVSRLAVMELLDIKHHAVRTMLMSSITFPQRSATTPHALLQENIDKLMMSDTITAYERDTYIGLQVSLLDRDEASKYNDYFTKPNIEYRQRKREELEYFKRTFKDNRADMLKKLSSHKYDDIVKLPANPNQRKGISNIRIEKTTKNAERLLDELNVQKNEEGEYRVPVVNGQYIIPLTDDELDKLDIETTINLTKQERSNRSMKIALTDGRVVEPYNVLMMLGIYEDGTSGNVSKLYRPRRVVTIKAV